MENGFYEALGGVLVGVGLVLVGMFIQYMFFTPEPISPCWASFADVYVETWHQDSLDNPWDLDNPDLGNRSCIQDQERPWIWRLPTIEEYHNMMKG